MKDIAIVYRNISKGNGEFLLEAFDLIKGKYDEGHKVFIDEDGREYKLIKNYDPRYQFMVDQPISMAKLKNKRLGIRKYYMKNSNSYTVTFNPTTMQFEARVSKLAFTVDMQREIDLVDFQRYLKRHIIGQDEAIEILTNTIKSNFENNGGTKIILTGPTGTGKTSLLKCACEYLKIPFCSVDILITDDNGHIRPRAVTEFLAELAIKYNDDIERALTGILVVEGVEDALASCTDNPLAIKELFKSLTAITNGIEFERKDNPNEKLNTSNLTVIIDSNLADFVISNSPTVTGFSDATIINNNCSITTADLRYCGIPSNFLRDSQIINTREFDTKDYENIIVNSPNSPLLKAQKEFQNNLNVKLYYDSAFLGDVICEAQTMGEGAHSIPELVQKYTQSARDAAAKHKVKAIKLTTATIKDPKNYDFKS